MFSENQVEFMKSLGINVDFNNLSNGDFVKIEDAVSEKLQKSGFDDNYKITEIGRTCESILDSIE